MKSPSIFYETSEGSSLVEALEDAINLIKEKKIVPVRALCQYELFEGTTHWLVDIYFYKKGTR